MVVTLDDTKRASIAMHIADMRLLQDLLIAHDQLLLDSIDSENVRPKLRDMLEQDQKNLGVIDTVRVQYGVQGEASEATQRKAVAIRALMQSDELSLAEKVQQQELLKHQQTMTGLVIHKAAQVVGADIEVAIAPLHTVNFENRAHQEQLKEILEILGVYELTGQEPREDLGARAEDAVAALTGIAGSVITRTDDEMSIRDVLLMDHSKADILFAEVLGSDEPQEIQGFFEQLYWDVKIHGLAEERVLYPALSPYYDQMPDIVEQTDEVIEMLDAARAIDPADPTFKERVEEIRRAVRSHVDQEENDIFPKIREDLSHEQQKQLATEFKAAKQKLQAERDQAAASISPPKTSATDQPQFAAMNSSNFWRTVFQSKAVINWVEGATLLFLDGRIRSALGTEPLVNAEYSQLFYGVVIIIGIGYWWVSQDISKNHAIVKLGILAQYSVFAVLAYHVVLGSLHPFYLVSGVLDLTFAILFSRFIYLAQEGKPGFLEQESVA
ncbi:MAG TPA: hemerythrin domain-containing protein [Trichocoleus sp.]